MAEILKKKPRGRPRIRPLRYELKTPKKPRDPETYRMAALKVWEKRKADPKYRQEEKAKIDKIRKMAAEGKTRAEVGDEVGLTKDGVAYHVNVHGIRFKRGNPERRRRGKRRVKIVDIHDDDDDDW